MTTNKEDIRRWLDLYMEGKTSLEEEALLTEYFRSPDADKDFADFKTMFDQFDEGEPSSRKKNRRGGCSHAHWKKFPAPPPYRPFLRRNRSVYVAQDTSPYVG